MPIEPTIHLDQFLKTCGVSTGGQAKLLIQSGDVRVNNEIETRRRRQLRQGDKVAIGKNEFIVGEIDQQEAPANKNENQVNKQVIECIDIGANLTHKSFRHDLVAVVDSAKRVGVSKVVLTGACLKSSRESMKLCQKYSGFFYSTAGVHPHDAKTFDQQTLNSLELLLGEATTVAVGECGLDFNRDFSPRADQRRCFEEHLKLAARLQKPLFLHERDAFDVFHEMLKEHRNSFRKAVTHCFTGTEVALKAYLDLDLHIGITGWICDERRGLHLRELVKQIPVNRLMIETDAPYLAPRDIRPKVQRNEPKHLPHILETIAACRGVDATTLAGQIMDTTEEFFGFI